MFYITAETYRRFTLAEVLIMAAMNMKTSRPRYPEAVSDAIRL